MVLYIQHQNTGRKARMKKGSKKMMKKYLFKLIADYNTYSELVALCYEKKKEGTCTEETLQWNRGNFYRIKEYLDDLAADLGVKITYTFGPHTFGYDDWKRELEYVTADISLTEIAKLDK